LELTPLICTGHVGTGVALARPVELARR